MARDQATLDNARVDLDRYTKLLAQNAIPEQQLATQKATVAQAEGVVKTDQAQIDSAKLNLVYCHINAPITGRIGLRLVDPGNIVHATDTNGLAGDHPDPAHQRHLHRRRGRSSSRASQTGRRPALERRGLGPRQHRQDRHRDARRPWTTRSTPPPASLRLRADFDNSANRSSPTSSSTCACWWSKSTASPWCSSAVIQRTTTSTYVYVVKPDHTVTVRQITVGVTEGDDTEITSGIAPGDVLVMTGVDKLQEGTQVNVQMADQQAAGGRQVRRKEEVSPSRTFILRPVATSLLMIGILLAGGVAYKQLPVSALARGGLSHHPGHHVLSRRQPGRDGVFGHRAARAPVRPGARACSR